MLTNSLKISHAKRNKCCEPFIATNSLSGKAAVFFGGVVDLLFGTYVFNIAFTGKNLKLFFKNKDYVPTIFQQKNIRGFLPFLLISE